MLSILNRYIITLFLKHALLIVTLISFILFIFDFIELARITASKNISIIKLLEMSLYRVPSHIQKIFGFLMLIASIVTYSKLNKNSELVVMKASGMSIWQISFPSVFAALIIGIFFTCALNPIASSMIRKYQKLEALHLKGNASLLSIARTGLWIKQYNQDGTDTIIHALRLIPSSKELKDVTFYIRSDSGSFISRIDAETAQLIDGKWLLPNAYESSENQLKLLHQNLTIPTELTFSQIQENMVTPETLSFWKLQSFINVAENSGLSVLKHKLYFYKLILAPIFFISAVLLGISFSISNSRHKNSGIAYFLCFIIGFAIYFLSDILNALAAAGSIQPIIASATPIVLMLGIGSMILLHLEEVRS